MDHQGTHLTEKDIRRYLEGALSVAQAATMKNHLETCRQCFTLYMEIREIDYLARFGAPASAALRQSIKNLAKQASGKLVRVRFKVLKDKFIIMSGDSENLEFQGVRAQFAYRGKTERGPVSFTHKIDDRVVTLTLSPVAGKKHYKLSVEFAKKEKFAVKMAIEGRLIETIEDARKQSGFLSIIDRGQEIDLSFEKSGKEIFAINLGVD